MELHTLYRAQTVPQRDAFAAAIGTTRLYYRNLSQGIRQPSALVALALERETRGAMTVAQLRPDLHAAMAFAGYRQVRTRKQVRNDGAQAHWAAASRPKVSRG
jgi:DNA-binding transcriptional regulator YdaS (Cro superfamily)